MTEVNLAVLFAGIVAGATPIVLATLGETLTEKSGLINLSLDGSIMLSAMTAFVVAYETRSVWAGYMAAAGVGATVAMVVALFGLYLGQSQIAVGFVLTLMTRDLAYFLGNSYSRLPGPQVESLSIPLLEKIPFFGEVFFRHNPVVYFSIVLIPLMWWYINRTPMGLKLRAVGEHPEAAYARGIRPSKVKLLYALAGGMLVGMAGATFSLFAKPGWGRPQGAEGTGWIALALVIFGGWDPIKAAIGAYFFAFLQIMGIYFQEWIPSVPAQVFQVAPFPLMIFTLILMHLAQKESVTRWSEKHEWTKPFLRFFSGKAPAALGKRLKSE
jgi:simple sugar transport system permease protein